MGIQHFREWKLSLCATFFEVTKLFLKSVAHNRTFIFCVKNPSHMLCSVLHIVVYRIVERQIAK